MNKLGKFMPWKARLPGRAFAGRGRLRSFYDRRSVYHGIRLLLLLALVGLGLALIPGRQSFDPFFDIRLGSVADREVVAPFDFQIYKSEQELADERRQAAASVMPLLELRPGVRDDAVQELIGFFDRIAAAERDSAVSAGLIGWKRYSRIRENGKGVYPIGPRVLGFLFSVDSLLTLSDEEVIYLLDPTRARILRSRLKDFLLARLRDGVVATEEYGRLDSERFRLRRSGIDEIIGREELTPVAAVLDQARALVVDPEYPEVSQNLFLGILQRFLRPNVSYDRDQTEHLRRLAVEQVRPMREETVLAGEKLVGRGERVTPQQMERLENLRAQLQMRSALSGEVNRLRHDLGLALLLTMILLSMGVFLYLHRRDIYDRLSRLSIIAISYAIVMLAAWLILRAEGLPQYLIPMAVSPMLVAYLIDDRAAVLTTVPLALILGLQTGFSIYFTMLALIGGIAGAVSVRWIASRKGQYVSILYLGGVYLLALLAIDYGYRGESLAMVASAAGWLALNAFYSTLVTVGLLPLFEYFFNVTSNFSLRELGDLNRPLLKRLAIEAPGTYHHSIILGSLSEAAAEGIGANPIYARVASYYHDIGKLGKPQYFIENQGGRQNPHDRLSPKMSCLVISNHVKEGVELARKARLPECIIDIIRQHHGNGHISYFYSKEKEQNPETTLVEEDFRYPGPKPQSREAAIIMLADAVESASRTLSEPTAPRIRQLIKEIVARRLDEGQLDNVDLTLSDLNRISGEFMTILIGVHHHRIEYPSAPGEKQGDARTRPGKKSKAAAVANGEDAAGKAVSSAREDAAGGAAGTPER